jgi:hypothetical protein
MLSIWNRRRPAPSTSRRTRPLLEVLEGRLAPATNIIVLEGPAGTGTLDHFLSPTNGTITTADDPGDLAATLSTGALEQVNSNVNISISADALITFSPLTSPLALQTANGNTAAFTVTLGSITFNNTANILTTAGAALSLTATTSITPGNLASSGGDISLTADDLTITQPVNAGTGRVTLKASSAGRPIDLGSALDPAGSLNLSDNELNEVQTGSVLQVGDASAGDITVSATISPASVLALSLQTGGGVTQAAGAHVTVPELAVRAVNAVSLSQGHNVGQALAASVTGAGQGFTFGQGFVTKLTVGSVDGLDGVTTNGGAVAISTTGIDLAGSDLEVDKNVTAGAAAIALTAAESLTVQPPASVSAGGAVNITVGAANGGSTSVISGTVAGSPVAVHTGAGADAVTVNFTAGAALPNGLTFTGSGNTGSGNDSLTLSDQAGAAAHSYVLGQTSLTRDGAQPVVYSGLAGGLNVVGGDLGDTFNVQGTAASTPTNLQGMGGDDTLMVFPSTATAPTLLSNLIFDAGAGANAVTVNEGNRTVGDRLRLGGSPSASAPASFYVQSLTQGWIVGYYATGGTFAGGLSVITGQARDVVDVRITPHGVPFSLNTRGAALTPGTGDVVSVQVVPQSQYRLTATLGPLARLMITGPGGFVLSMPAAPAGFRKVRMAYAGVGFSDFAFLPTTVTTINGVVV